MKKTSLVHAKAHLSELVDAAEHRGQRILILRHGKPAAALVPVSVARPQRSKGRTMSIAEAKELLRRAVDSAPSSSLTIEEALGRSRLD